MNLFMGDDLIKEIKSISDNQSEILKSIIDLHCPDGIDVDLTYGNGCFYKEIEKPFRCYDLEPLHPFIIEADSRNMPIAKESCKSIIYDPPFLTYVRRKRTGNGKMVMARRFSGYWSYDDLKEDYTQTLNEVSRILAVKGILIFKCQDIVHNHRLHLTHLNVIEWAKVCNLRVKDLFILTANHRMPRINKKGIQKHARIWHSYFIVFQKEKVKA